MSSLCDVLMKTPWLRWLGYAMGCHDTPTPPPVPANKIWTATNGVVFLRVDKRHGGAIYSIVRDGFEYIPDTDQGGQVQTALQLDNGGEGYNPTEGGSVTDAGGPVSSAVINAVNHPAGNILEVSTRMAYWEPYQGQKLSGYTLNKRVTIGEPGLVGVIKDDITLQSEESHQTVNIEGLTAYINMGLNVLYSCDVSGTLQKLEYRTSVVFDPAVMVNSDVPLIAASPDGAHAFAFWSPGRNYSAWMGAGAGTRNASNKLNAAGQGYTPFPAGKYSWWVYIVVGSLSDVRSALMTLSAR